jgi:hypothetical protein
MSRFQPLHQTIPFDDAPKERTDIGTVRFPSRRLILTNSTFLSQAFTMIILSLQKIKHRVGSSSFPIARVLFLRCI